MSLSCFQPAYFHHLCSMESYDVQSKWMISGASFMELDRPTEKISLAQYSALTLTGFFFSRYALLVQPINYTLW